MIPIIDIENGNLNAQVDGISYLGSVVRLLLQDMQ